MRPQGQRTALAAARAAGRMPSMDARAARRFRREVRRPVRVTRPVRPADGQASSAQPQGPRPAGRQGLPRLCDAPSRAPYRGRRQRAASAARSGAADGRSSMRILRRKCATRHGPSPKAASERAPCPERYSTARESPTCATMSFCPTSTAVTAVQPSSRFSPASAWRYRWSVSTNASSAPRGRPSQRLPLVLRRNPVAHAGRTPAEPNALRLAPCAAAEAALACS